MTPHVLANAGVVIPQLPNKLFFSIREVSEVCDIEPHVLRYWETEFRQIKPAKKSGNRRFYRQRDIYAILHVKHLLYDQKFTIKGAKKRLANGEFAEAVEPQNMRDTIRAARDELASVLRLLDA